MLEKKPGCPDRFVWRGEAYCVIEVLSEWHDYGRRGRMARNMRPEHAATASRRGSWGVGRDYYRVRTDTARSLICTMIGRPRKPETAKEHGSSTGK
jgi:hypothetical protein